jgi:hypothetical protein
MFDSVNKRRIEEKMAEWLEHHVECGVRLQSVRFKHRRIALLKGIARGEKAIEEGRSLTHKQAKQRMSRWLK